MSTPITQQSNGTLNPGRGLRSFSTPGDPAGYVGVSGIHYNLQLGGMDFLFGIPVAGQINGASYLSTIHGGLGSDATNPKVITGGFPSGRPAFPGPEVTGYYVSGPNALNAKANGISNTEKVQRSPSDAANGANNGTIQLGVQGRRSLNFCLWVVPFTGNLDFVFIDLYRDLNAQDKVSGVFGAGFGPADVENALLVGTWGAVGNVANQNKPNLVTRGPFEIPASTSLYAIFRTASGNGQNLVVGDIWLS